MGSYIWKYQNKQTAREAYYGNLRELCKNETIMINGQIKSEISVRRLMPSKKHYEDDNIILERIKVKRSNFKRQ